MAHRVHPEPMEELKEGSPNTEPMKGLKNGALEPNESDPATMERGARPSTLRRTGSFLTKSVSSVNLGAAEKKHYDGDIERERTKLEREVLARQQAAEALIEGLTATPEDPTRLYVPSMLKGALFCGHLVTDMDSIAGAIGAADLYSGLACRASEVNSETAWCLERWGCEKPPPIEEMLEQHPDAGVCLVDHQQTSQLNPAIPAKRIVGVIDHHALQSETIVTEMPIFIDIRPWGSMSTIITHGYMASGRKPPPAIAGMLLSAIISDTLNLMSPTTTKWDSMMVSILAVLAGVDDINLLASQQFKAKSRELAGLTAPQLVSGDRKAFKLKTDRGVEYKVGFAVVETTDDQVIMDRKGELLPELLAAKVEDALDFVFLAVVNIVLMRSNLLICDAAEKALAQAAFGQDSALSAEGDVMDLGARVSRKKEFIPPLTSAVKTFQPCLSPATSAAHSMDLAAKVEGSMLDVDTVTGKLERQYSNGVPSPHKATHKAADAAAEADADADHEPPEF